ncbi:PadR family transcriptional regulator [Herbihabitans rhizosphaerae]|uniref:PadR family transcriptional regulator n=1 Tax=Herbihabitans rhizosphaerae TaxID=1872711 RepID=A0A4V2ERI6_9PSEU|nr:helix-turn-helix transcriptional regulator [Herbihabitans rhizosphaerae]RZS31443.1 PadR family transcriptional regulator [Herbihabitans rhizosphaerae]
MTGRSPRPSPLAVVLLALLAEEPMHPYRMRELIKERAKDKIANVAQRNSVYQTIDRLRRLDLIAVAHTARDEGRPERTVYEITDEGQRTLHAWLTDMLATPAREFPEFPAALASMALLESGEVLDCLCRREKALAGELEASRAELAAAPELPRLFVIEDEYRAVLIEAELGWLRSVIGDLRSGALAWTEESVRALAQRLGG